MTLWAWIKRRHYARLRRLDKENLWPSLLHVADGDVTMAKRAMLTHALNDHAWYGGLTRVQIEAEVNALAGETTRLVVQAAVERIAETHARRG